MQIKKGAYKSAKKNDAYKSIEKTTFIKTSKKKDASEETPSKNIQLYYLIVIAVLRP